MVLNDEWLKKKCVPCEGGVPALDPEQVAKCVKLLTGWSLERMRIKKNYKFKDFVAAMVFVNKVAELAENEGHHPDISIHYNQVEITIWTHAVGGLTENDFILAAKIDA